MALEHLNRSAAAVETQTAQNTQQVPRRLRGAQSHTVIGGQQCGPPRDPLQPQPGGGGISLAQQHALTTEVTDKREDILSNLPHDLSQELHDKISSGTVDTVRLRSLLSFTGASARRGTNKSKRLVIRIVLAAYVAKTGSIGNALLLKSALKTLPENKLEEIQAALSRGEHLATALTMGMLTKNQDADHRAEMVSLKTALVALPAEPTRAGQRLSHDGVISLAFDQTGKICIESMPLKYGGTLDMGPMLTDEQVDGLLPLFIETCKTRFSRLNANMQLMQYHREQNAGGNSKSMLDCFRQFPVDGDAATQKYNVGDCISVANRLEAQLTELGIQCLTTGVSQPNLTKQKTTDRRVVDTPDHTYRMETGGITHVDVLVPYRTESGEERAIRMVPGQGIHEMKDVYQDLPKKDFLAYTMLGFKYGDLLRVNGDGRSIDTAKVQKESMGYLVNLQLLNNHPLSAWHQRNNQIFGVQLVQGVLYLNRKASEEYAGAKPDAEDAVKFNYRDAIANPNELIDFKVPDGQGGLETRRITKLTALQVFLNGVAAHFGQPSVFVDNVLELLTNEAEYKDAVLWDWVKETHGIQ